MCFVIKTPQKDLILAALNPEERMDWMNAVELAVHGTFSRKSMIKEEKKNESNVEKTETQKKQPTEAALVVACTGWVEKRGVTNSAWKKRWLVLSVIKLIKAVMLIYFESDANGGSNKKGEINLAKSTVEKQATKAKKGKYPFVIHTKDKESQPRDFIISAETQEDCDKWVASITEAVNSLED